MQCYKYDIGGRFTEVAEVMLSPVDGLPMLPFNSTLIAPPEALDGHYVAFAGGEWVQIEVVVQPTTVPQIISMRQCEKYLWSLDSGTTLQSVNALASTLGPLAEIEWRRSHEVWRSSALVELMRTSFGWTVEQMDQMFLDASEL